MSNAEDASQDLPPNPVDSSTNLKPGLASEEVRNTIHPQQTQFEEDSAVTKAEKIERHGDGQDIDNQPTKRIKLDASAGVETRDQAPTKSERRKGVAPIKAESVSLFHPMDSRLTRLEVYCASARKQG